MNTSGEVHGEFSVTRASRRIIEVGRCEANLEQADAEV